MFTSLITLVLTVQTTALGADIKWTQDYAQAQQQCVAENKPIAVIVGSGNQGFAQLVRDGGLSKEASDLLSSNYVCVYVDAASPKGKQLAEAFELNGSTGVILSDRSGVYQKFWHEGALSNQELISNLTRCALNSTASSYGPTSQPVYQQSGSSVYQPTYQSGSSVYQAAPSYCPNCQNAARYRR